MKKPTQEQINQNKKHIELVEERIKEKLSLGGDHLNEDIEEDPPAKELLPDDVDYLYKTPSRRFKAFIAHQFEKNLFKKEAKKHQLTIVGEENLNGIEGGAIITGNHFHYFESINAFYIAKKLRKQKKYYKIVKEGNYSVPGFLGFFLKNTHTLPLSSNMKTMIKFNKSIKELLSKGSLILVYPEQSMWWNFSKPRPHKDGAAHIACKNNVPIISYFVTLDDLNTLDEYGYPIKKYTLHILPPLYPDPNKSLKENVLELTEKNYKMWVEVYEKHFKEELKY